MNNYFDIIGIPVSYHIDKQILLEKYIVLQAQNHPDSNSAQSDVSELINSAYSTLNDDFARMRHIIELNNINLDISISDPNLMNMIMEKQILLEEIDISNRDEVLSEIKSEIHLLLEKCATFIESLNYNDAVKYFTLARCLKRLLSGNN